MTTKTKERPSASAELERLRRVQADTAAALAAERESLEEASAALRAADELETAAALGETPADEVARKRAAALDQRRKAEEAVARHEAVLAGLVARLEEAERLAADEEVAALVALRDEALAQRDALQPGLREHLEAAEAVAADYLRARSTVHDLHARVVAAADGPVSLPADEQDWHAGCGLDALGELLGARPWTPTTDAERRAESESRRAAERERSEVYAAARALNVGAYDALGKLPEHLYEAAREKARELRELAAAFHPRPLADGEIAPLVLPAEPGLVSVAERGARERERLAAGAREFAERMGRGHKAGQVEAEEPAEPVEAGAA